MNTLKTMITVILLSFSILGYGQNSSEKKAMTNIENVYKSMPGAFDKVTYEKGVLTLVFYAYSQTSLDLKTVKEFSVFPSDFYGYQIYYRTKQNDKEWVHFENYKKERDAKKVKEQLDSLLSNL